MIRHIFFLFFVFLLIAAPAYADVGIQTTAKQAIVLDYDTGAVLYEKNADEHMPTSSMSKTMTLYVVFDQLKKGKLSLDQQFTVSEKAWRMQGSKMFIEVGKQVKIDDLIHGVAIQSGNDAAVCLAEGIAGSEEGFADMLNKKAKELGMNNSHFMDASGWPNDDHYSTARDLATLARAMIRDFPEHYPLFSQIDYTYNNIKQGNRNPLLYKNIGADGLKTGHTDSGGYGLIGSGVYQGRRVIIVLNGLANEKDRANESANVLDWGMKNFVNKTFFKTGQVVETAAVVMGLKDHVPMVVGKDLKLTMPRALADDYKVTVRYKEPLEAPVAKGQEVGMLELEIPHQDKISVPLFAGEDVSRLGLLAGTVTKFGFMLTHH